MDIAFKNIIYDFYSKDLSSKVKSTKKLQQQTGKFVTAKPPYGYVTSKENRYVLEIELESAKIVQTIFQLTLERKLTGEIAKYLNQNKIPIPVQRNFYKFGFRDRWYNETNIDNNYWVSTTILKI